MYLASLESFPLDCSPVQVKSLSLETRQVNTWWSFLSFLSSPLLPAALLTPLLDRRWEQAEDGGVLVGGGAGISSRAVSLVPLDSCVFSFVFHSAKPTFLALSNCNRPSFLLAGGTKLVCYTPVTDVILQHNRYRVTCGGGVPLILKSISPVLRGLNLCFGV